MTHLNCKQKTIFRTNLDHDFFMEGLNVRLNLSFQLLDSAFIYINDVLS